MNWFQTFRIALKALLINKMRSFLTILGVIIGVSAVIAMVAIGSGARAQVQAQFSAMGTNMLIIQSGSSQAGGVRGGYGSQPTLTWDDVKAIRTEVPSVAAVAVSATPPQTPRCTSRTRPMAPGSVSIWTTVASSAISRPWRIVHMFRAQPKPTTRSAPEISSAVRGEEKPPATSMLQGSPSNMPRETAEVATSAPACSASAATVVPFSSRHWWCCWRWPGS